MTRGLFAAFAVSALALLSTELARANDRTAHYTAYGELGERYHNGTAGKAWDKAYGTYAQFQGQSRRGILRPSLGAMLEFIYGNATLASGSVSGTAYVGALEPGVELFFRDDHQLQPFLEARAVAAWTYANLSPVRPVQNERSLALGFGYQLGVGLDLKYHGDTRAVRLHFHYFSFTAKIADQTGFLFTGYGVGFAMSY